MKHEATALGIDTYFRGGVLGALRTVQEYNKEMVIKRILKDFQLQGQQLVIFGDGRVEIQHARDNGAIAVGVASDEVRSYGLNPWKRNRLLKAGADIIVPDYLEGEKLFRYLFQLWEKA